MGSDIDPVRDGDEHGERRDRCHHCPRSPGPRPRRLRRSPPGRLTSRSTVARQVQIADTDPDVQAARAGNGRLSSSLDIEPGVWQVGFFAAGQKVVLVEVNGSTGEIENSWTGSAVDWPMARGRPGQFGHLLNSPFVWIPMALVFFFALFDFKRPGPDRPPRPARPALVRHLARLLQLGRDRRLGAALLPAAALSAGAHAVDRLPRADGRAAADDGRALGRDPLHRPRRLPRDAQHRRLGRDRRRLRGRDRRRPDHPRAADLRRRRLPRRQSRRATRTGRPTTSPTCRSRQ